MQDTITTETNHAKDQAAAQVASIRELIAALTRKGAAYIYAENMTEATARGLVTANLHDLGVSNEFVASAEIEDVRNVLADGLADAVIDLPGFTFDEDDARAAITGDALSVEVRSGWYNPGESYNDRPAPEEFNILLCTGGPAVRILGDLDQHCQPTSARVEFQDWGTPWTEYRLTGDEADDVLAFCREFYFGE